MASSTAAHESQPGQYNCLEFVAKGMMLISVLDKSGVPLRKHAEPFHLTREDLDDWRKVVGIPDREPTRRAERKSKEKRLRKEKRKSDDVANEETSADKKPQGLPCPGVKHNGQETGDGTGSFAIGDYLREVRRSGSFMTSARVKRRRTTPSNDADQDDAAASSQLLGDLTRGQEYVLEGASLNSIEDTAPKNERSNSTEKTRRHKAKKEDRKKLKQTRHKKHTSSTAEAGSTQGVKEAPRQSSEEANKPPQRLYSQLLPPGYGPAGVERLCKKTQHTTTFDTPLSHVGGLLNGPDKLSWSHKTAGDALPTPRHNDSEKENTTLVSPLPLVQRTVPKERHKQSRKRKRRSQGEVDHSIETIDCESTGKAYAVSTSTEPPGSDAERSPHKTQSESIEGNTTLQENATQVSSKKRKRLATEGQSLINDFEKSHKLEKSHRHSRKSRKLRLSESEKSQGQSAFMVLSPSLPKRAKVAQDPSPPPSRQAPAGKAKPSNSESEFVEDASSSALPSKAYGEPPLPNPEPSPQKPRRSINKPSKSKIPKPVVTAALPTDVDLPSRGPFNEREISLLSSYVEKYRRDMGLTQHELNEKIQASSKDMDFSKFWLELLAVLPNRRRDSIYKMARRRWNNYEKRGKWTEDEDEELIHAYELKPNQWKEIGGMIGRMGADCRDRWRNYLKCGKNMKMNEWTGKEEKDLLAAVDECLVALKKEEERQRKLQASAPDAEDRKNPEALLSWSIVSEKLGGQRSRLQCMYKWKRLQERLEKGEKAASQIPNRKDHKSRRMKRAEENYKNMLPGDKYEVLCQVRDVVEGFDHEENIPWAVITRKHPESVWTTTDRKVAFARAKRAVPNQSFGVDEGNKEREAEAQSLGGLVAAMIRDVEHAYPDQLHSKFQDTPEGKYFANPAHSGLSEKYVIELDDDDDEG
ncbi:hypothetical protein B0A49_07855 [Cryomyces minteri]|uniref:DNA-binding protein REB1 n=1 Tax=Cryomyces minteri TaxID=331657 RepID=A0A4U0X4U3_9PEZI|nr:hypothetical protein B0A49_07855 [Cryomyces minteri]